MNIPAITTGELRKFGLMMGAVIAALFGLLLPWLFDHAWPRWPWLLGGAFWLAALAVPAALAPVHAGWMRFGHALGWLNTRIILGLVFFTVFLAAALFMKLLGRDPMSRKTDSSLASYRSPSAVRRPDRLEKPF